MADYDKLLQVPRGTKARLEQIKLNLLVNTIVYATDTKELGIKLSDGNIEYFKNATDIDARIDTIETSKQDKLVAGENVTIDENTNVISASGGEVDLNAMAYFNYAGRIYGDKYSLLANAWGSSLAVNPSEISEDSDYSSQRGREQYPNGEAEGVIIPQGVASIGDSAFAQWQSNNQPLIIPQGVTTIGNYAFMNWQANNQPLVIPNSVTSIGSNAFMGWSSNNQPLVIPNSVTTIEEAAFFGWELVPYVEIQVITPPTLAGSSIFGGAFDGQNNAPIYVPDESVNAYKTATNWVDLADRIFPIGDKAGVIGDIESALDAILGV